jgi:hypothetical protein
MILRGILAKIFKGGYGAGTFLRLVKDNEGVLRVYHCARLDLQITDDPFNVQVRGKDPPQTLVMIEVKVYGVFVVFPAKLPHQPRLTNLPDPVEYQGLALTIVLPRYQIFEDIPLHIALLAGLQWLVKGKGANLSLNS